MQDSKMYATDRFPLECQRWFSSGAKGSSNIRDVQSTPILSPTKKCCHLSLKFSRQFSSQFFLNSMTIYSLTPFTVRHQGRHGTPFSLAPSFFAAFHHYANLVHIDVWEAHLFFRRFQCVPRPWSWNWVLSKLNPILRDNEWNSFRRIQNLGKSHLEVPEYTTYFKTW